ncbi:hypothetical protein OIU77_028375 [Salix suchowensis]|uniref:NADH:ubiquinone reductase (non-electrogenic) n=1 Tax=Salix suchowensis TaxID=1278906 RepID=A0ABQ9BH65_9ROSI|nr:hypothetical protein OIU77_028375 [Salix suchowensis]
MSFFRNLIQLSTSKSKPLLQNPNFLFTSLSHFTTDTPTSYAGLEPTKRDEKPRVVVLGSGWAGCPWLSPLVGSNLPYRKHLGSYFFLANCTGLDTEKHTVHCETVTDGLDTVDPWRFKISYDKLVIALGAEATTFGIRGVKEHAIFLREVHHAQEIRRKLLLNLMLSDVPGLSEEEKSRLLHCVVVGGGPTGVEFSGELSDFILKDVRQTYAHVKDYIHVTLIEANEILSSFDDSLRRYATKQLTKSGVHLVRGIVKDVKPQKLILTDGTEVPYGLLVWSTGVGPSPFVKSLEFPKSPGGRIGIDEWLRVPSAPDVFAIGDCSGFLESTGKPVLPALAQVAERQGKYLANLLNKIGKDGGGRSNSGKEVELGGPFALQEAKGLALKGFASWFIWRSAYLTRVISWRNRFYVAINWATTFACHQTAALQVQEKHGHGQASQHKMCPDLIEHASESEKCHAAGCDGDAGEIKHGV